MTARFQLILENLSHVRIEYHPPINNEPGHYQAILDLADSELVFELGHGRPAWVEDFQSIPVKVTVIVCPR